MEEEPWQPGENVLVPVVSGTRDSYTFENAWYAVAGSSGPVTDFIYEDAAAVSREGMIAVCRSGKWGFCDVSGSEVIPCEYESINVLNTEDTQGISYTQERLILSVRAMWLLKKTACGVIWTLRSASAALYFSGSPACSWTDSLGKIQ